MTRTFTLALAVAVGVTTGCASIQPSAYDSPGKARSKTAARWALGIASLGMADHLINPHRYPAGYRWYPGYGANPPQRVVIEHRGNRSGVSESDVWTGRALRALEPAQRRSTTITLPDGTTVYCTEASQDWVTCN
jgi:hypothetical protein